MVRSNRWLTVILIDPSNSVRTGRPCAGPGSGEHRVPAGVEADALQPVFRAAVQRSTLKAEKENLKHESSRQGYPVPRSPIRVSRRKRSLAGWWVGSIAEGLFDRGLCLPSGTALTDA